MPKGRRRSAPPLRFLCTASAEGNSTPVSDTALSMLRLLVATSQRNTREAQEAGAEKEEGSGFRHSRRRRHERAVRATQACDDIRIVKKQGAVGGIRRC